MTEAGLPAEHGSEPGGLQRRTARGLTWTMVHTWGGQALSLVVFVILARLLTPADFGLVALGTVAQAFLAQSTGARVLSHVVALGTVEAPAGLVPQAEDELQPPPVQSRIHSS